MTDNELDELMARMKDLRQQAKVEHSHHYTEKVLNMAIEAITDLRFSIKVLRHLAEGQREVQEDLERELRSYPPSETALAIQKRVEGKS